MEENIQQEFNDKKNAFCLIPHSNHPYILRIVNFSETTRKRSLF